MEDVLDLYHLPPKPAEPVVGMDETSKQLIEETRLPLSPEPGQLERFDYEYKRNGVTNLFMFCAPFEGWRQVKVTDRRTKADWAECIRQLVDDWFPKAKRIHLVLDNLNTHDPASLYEFFQPAEAKRILDRIQFHFTPKHGSWLNVAEIELSLLARQCLAQRIPDKQTLKQQVTAWANQRNASEAKIDWQFTTNDARIKLKKLYPSIEG